MSALAHDPFIFENSSKATVNVVGENISPITIINPGSGYGAMTGAVAQTITFPTTGIDSIPKLSSGDNFSKEEIEFIGRAKKLAKEHLLTFDPLVGSKGKYILAGGCFTSFFQLNPVNDYDLFFLDNGLAEENMRYFVKNLPNCETRFKETPISSYMNTNGMITFVVLDKTTQYQYIFTKHKTREEVLANFDFAHAQTSYDPATDKLYISKKTYEAIMTKTLVPNIPIENIQKYRVKKYLDRGFKWQDGISIPVL